MGKQPAVIFIARYEPFYSADSVRAWLIGIEVMAPDSTKRTEIGLRQPQLLTTLPYLMAVGYNVKRWA